MNFELCRNFHLSEGMLPIVATSGQTAIDIEIGTKNNVRRLGGGSLACSSSALGNLLV